MKNDEMPELKPCPFCPDGGDPSLCLEYHDFDGAEVCCNDCGAGSGHFINDKEGSAAIKHWNTPTDLLEDHKAAILELREALTYIESVSFITGRKAVDDKMALRSIKRRAAQTLKSTAHLVEE